MGLNGHGKICTGWGYEAIVDQQRQISIRARTSDVQGGAFDKIMTQLTRNQFFHGVSQPNHSLSKPLIRNVPGLS